LTDPAGEHRSARSDDAVALRLGRALRANQAGVTAYLLHNGSATYILWQA